MSHPNFFSAY